jgi:hypothetical protein
LPMSAPPPIGRERNSCWSRLRCISVGVYSGRRVRRQPQAAESTQSPKNHTGLQDAGPNAG